MAKKDKKSGKKDREVAEEKRHRESRNDLDKGGVFSDLQDSTIQSVIGVLFFVGAIIFLLPLFHKGGAVGVGLYNGLSKLLGLGYYLIPALLFILSISFFGDQNRRFPLSKILGSVLFFVSGLGLFSLIKPSTEDLIGAGGIVGNWVTIPILKMFDTVTGFIILIAIALVSLIIIFDSSIRKEHFLFWRLFKKDEELDEDLADGKLGAGEEAKIEKSKHDAEIKAVGKQKDNKSEEEDADAGVLASIKKKMASDKAADDAQANGANKEDDGLIKVSKKSFLLGKAYVPPPLSLLENDRGKPGVGDIKANANIIKRTLQNFGIDVEMDEVSIGPSVTRYALKPAEGVKLSRILGLQNNLSLALAAHPIRIEAPIPGKSLVGIEIPNTAKTTVGLGTLLAQEEYQTSDKPLLVALGKGISGKSHFGNLAKMPHMLIAGATGSGKSVTIHAIITSLLYRNSPDNLRMIMIDPKRVELTLYNKIPHLLTPVITDAKKAILSLKWAAKEMDRRYNILEQASVRDIGSYHKNILLPTLEQLKKEGKATGKDGAVETDEQIETMPYIVIVIDELADIMQTFPRELESAIVRLAQMSRAVGIHLIISTQRPSVNVITGLIKANVPARVALQVASQIDSRTILDTRGAEELLGAGDMLYLSGETPTPQRIQSAFISEGELKKVVKYLSNNIDSLPSEISLGGDARSEGVNDPVFNSSFDDMGDPEDDDDLYEEAKDIVIKAGKASTSYIQRKLRVGYARAARLMDILEDRGVIGPADGAKPREILAGHESSSMSGGNNSARNDDGLNMPTMGPALAQTMEVLEEIQESATNDEDEVVTVDEDDTVLIAEDDDETDTDDISNVKTTF